MWLDILLYRQVHTYCWNTTPPELAQASLVMTEACLFADGLSMNLNLFLLTLFIVENFEYFFYS